jgi:hypothetical protein
MHTSQVHRSNMKRLLDEVYTYVYVMEIECLRDDTINSIERSSFKKFLTPRY